MQEKPGEFMKPHLLFLKLIEEIFTIIHKPMASPTLVAAQATSSPAPPPSKVYKQLDQFLAAHLEELMPEFKAMSERYKTKYVKAVTAEEFGL
jgi:hypothetical protein